MFHDKPFLQSFVKRKKNAFIQHTIRGLWSYPFLQPFLQPIFPFLQRPILFSVYYPRWLISRPCIDDKMHPVCHFYGKLIANLFVLLLIRKLWRQMFFDKLCKLLTTGLSLFAGELHNLLNIERIVMHLVIQVLIELQSPLQLATELNEKGYRTKTGREWNLKNMFHILHNCTYAGMIPYKGESYPGEHEAIIDRETWDAVQRFLGSRQAAKPKTLARRTDRTMPLKGQVYCGHCDGPMTLTMTQRKHRAYGYYRCSRDEKRAESKCPVRHISANELERAVFTVLSSILRTPMMLARLEDFCDAEVPQIADAIGQDFWNEATLVERRNIAEFLVAKVTLYVDRFELEIKADGISAFKDQIDHEMKEESAKTEMLPSGNVLVSVPFDLQVRGNGKCLVLPDGAVADKSRTAFLMAVARGFHWQALIDDGTYANIKALAEAIGIDSGVVAKATRLTLLSPKIVHKLILGEADLSMQTLRHSFPMVWEKQESELLK